MLHERWKKERERSKLAKKLNISSTAKSSPLKSTEFQKESSMPNAPQRRPKGKSKLPQPPHNVKISENNMMKICHKILANKTIVLIKRMFYVPSFVKCMRE